MVGRPGSLPEFEARFPDDAACARWLFERRWPDGFRCPGCGHVKGWIVTTSQTRRLEELDEAVHDASI